MTSALLVIDVRAEVQNAELQNRQRSLCHPARASGFAFSAK